MIPLLIVGGVLVLWLLERQSQPAILAAAGRTGATTGAAVNPIQLQAMGQQEQITGMEIGSGIGIATTVGTDIASSLGSAAAKAIPIVGAAIGAVADILLAQHTARLKGAINENQALDQIIPAFDADIQQIVVAFNSGKASAAQAIAALKQTDTQIYAYLKKQVGPPGTAWDGSGNCGKGCTAGCCVYYNDLHSAIYGPDPAVQGGKVMDGATGLIPAITKGGGACWIPEVYPPSNSQYGNYQRAGYVLTVTHPAAAVAASNESILQQLGL